MDRLEDLHLLNTRVQRLLRGADLSRRRTSPISLLENRSQSFCAAHDHRLAGSQTSAYWIHRPPNDVPLSPLETRNA
jgi:hypothetical protein